MTYDIRTLAQRLAGQYRAKAELALGFATEHAHTALDETMSDALCTEISAHAKAYAAEGMHCLRAARAADAGDTSPKPYTPAT